MKDIKTITILILLGLIVYLKQCTEPKKVVVPKEVIKIETKYDTIVKVSEVYVPTIKEVIVEVHDTITEIDTVKVIGDYFTKKFYSDTLNEDSLIAIVNDTVYKNSIISRQFKYELIYPTVTITKDSSVLKNEFFWGLDMAGTKNQLNLIGAGIMLKTKRDNVYGLGLGINQDIQPILSLKFYKKFK